MSSFTLVTSLKTVSPNTLSSVSQSCPILCDPKYTGLAKILFGFFCKMSQPKRIFGHPNTYILGF